MTLTRYKLVQCLMLDSLAFGDWWDIRNWADDEKDSSLPKFYDLRAIDPDDNISLSEWVRVTPTKYVNAMHRVATTGNPYNLRDDIVESISGVLRDTDSAAASRFDSICGDCVLQVLTMGKVEFG